QWAASSPHAGVGYLVRQAVRAGWQLSVSVLSEAIKALRPYRLGDPNEPVDQLFERLRGEVERQQRTGDIEDIEDGADGAGEIARLQLEALLQEGLELLRREPY